MFQSPLSSADINEALQHLKHKHEILLFHVSDQNTEKAFNFENHPYLFIDSENGRKIKIVPSLIKEQYQKKKPQIFITMSNKCVANLRIDLVEVDTRDDFNKILYSLSRQKKKNEIVFS